MRVGLALLARTDSKDAGELQKEETTINGKGKNEKAVLPLRPEASPQTIANERSRK